MRRPPFAPGGAPLVLVLLVACGAEEAPPARHPHRRVRNHEPSAAHEGPCPEEMALVQDRVCVDKWEASLVELTAAGERPFSPYQSPDGASVTVRAVSVPDVVPQGYISRDAADAACKASEKRLCEENEWIAA